MAFARVNSESHLVGECVELGFLFREDFRVKSRKRSSECNFGKKLAAEHRCGRRNTKVSLTLPFQRLLVSVQIRGEMSIVSTEQKMQVNHRLSILRNQKYIKCLANVVLRILVHYLLSLSVLH